MKKINKTTNILQERVSIWSINFLPQKDAVHYSPLTELCGSEN